MLRLSESDEGGETNGDRGILRWEGSDILAIEEGKSRWFGVVLEEHNQRLDLQDQISRIRQKKS